MDLDTLQYMAESIKWVLSDYEKVVDDLSSNTQASTRESVPMIPTPISDLTPNAWDIEQRNLPKAFVGTLELEPAEVVMVVQEALSHSIARLAVMLQDLEEEVSVLKQQQLNVDNLLREKDLKDLVSRLFRLLGRVNRIDVRNE